VALPRDAQHILVTGAAGAIGRAIACAMARHAPAARLTLVDNDRPRLEDAVREVRGRAAVWDLSEPESLEAAWNAAVVDAPVDVLVNCAGVMELRSFERTPWALGERLLAIDLESPLRLMALAIPSMRAGGGGLVVNVASMAGLVPLRGSSYYGAAKAGLAMASEVARAELAPHGVHVLTVYPGPVSSELERRARAQVRPSWLSRAIPTGRPDVLADRILDALERRAPRVAYPPLYAVAARALAVSRRITERLSPEPLD
jgi:short-subunit dehydrogenase